MLPENLYYGDKVTARFAPKHINTLRECMKPLIGRVFEFEWVGFGFDPGPYAGQSQWLIVGGDQEIPVECKVWWVPHEDLEIISQ